MRRNHKIDPHQQCPIFQTCQIPGIVKIMRMVIDNPASVSKFLDRLDKIDGCDNCTCDKGEAGGT